ncbi:MAG: efflux RND transporter periplasmic adaptor subunit [Evtepia gabavorous]
MDEESVSVALSVRCTDVYVEVGDTVSAGQAICKLDISATMANYETASMSYDNAKKSYAEQSSLLSQQVAQAEKNVSDTQALFDMGAASQAELDSAKLSLENAKASMNSALDQLEVGMQNYKATMEQLKASLANVDSNGNVAAPISGTILSLSAVENGFVSPSAPVATIDSTTDMEVKVGVSESLIGKLQVGGRVSVSIDAADKEFKGTISALEKSADATTHLYGVTIQVPSAYSSGLLSGMFADVTFYTDTQSDVVIVPTEAIQTGMDGQYVYTIDSDNIAHRIPVETGLVGDGETEITSGLSGGETLVTVGQFYLSEGAAVRVVAPEVAS